MPYARALQFIHTKTPNWNGTRMWGNGKRSIVLELQDAAADSQTDISELLRKCLIVATKLQLDDFKDWINHELHGYDFESCEDVPKYRHLRAEMRVHNPYHGLQPLYMAAELENDLCDVKYRAAIGNTVSVLDRQRSGDGGKSSPLFPLTPRQKQFLLEHMELPLEPVRLVSETQLDMIVDAVRSTILEWSLKLEAEGILGEGMTFSREEKSRAASSNQIHIRNFQGILGDVSESSVTQNLDLTVTEGDFQSLERCLIAQGLTPEDLKELKDAIDKDPTPEGENLGPMVSSWIGRMITKAASGTWAIATGAAGGVLSTSIASYYGISQ